MRRLLDMGMSGVLLDESGGRGRIWDRDVSVDLSRSRWDIKQQEVTKEGVPQELGGGGDGKIPSFCTPGAISVLSSGPALSHTSHSVVLHSLWPCAQAPVPSLPLHPQPAVHSQIALPAHS